MRLLLTTALLTTLLFSNESDEKTMGIEINPFRLLIQESHHKGFDGSFSFFLEEQNVEIRIPIYWDKQKGVEYANTETTINAEYRYFINDQEIDGLFVGALAKYAKLNNEETDVSTNKLGAGFILGYRYMPKDSNWYWGASVSVVRYFTGTNNIFDGGGIDMTWWENDSKGIIDIDLLNIGYRF